MHYEELARIKSKAAGYQSKNLSETWSYAPGLTGSIWILLEELTKPSTLPPTHSAQSFTFHASLCSLIVLHIFSQHSIVHTQALQLFHFSTFCVLHCLWTGVDIWMI